MGGKFPCDFDDDLIDIGVIHDKQIQNSAKHFISDYFGGDLNVSKMQGQYLYQYGRLRTHLPYCLVEMS